MQCMVNTFLSSNVERLKRSNVDTLSRFIRSRYKIHMSTSVLQARIQNCIKEKQRISN